MLRKLSLTGLLQFVQRGTATQVFCGCALAFVSSGLQPRLLPYREPEANVLIAVHLASTSRAMLPSKLRHL